MHCPTDLEQSTCGDKIPSRLEDTSVMHSSCPPLGFGLFFFLMPNSKEISISAVTFPISRRSLLSGFSSDPIYLENECSRFSAINVLGTRRKTRSF